MKDDEFFMRQALAEAQKSLKKKEVPVGAVLVFEKEIVSRAHNEPIAKSDPTAHAEIVVIRKASSKRKNYRLSGCDLYVTLEPCAMCLGAAVHARIRKLVFGAIDPKSGAVESVMKFPLERMNHRVEIVGGVLADECSQILRDFFKKKRQSKKE
ncbi:MAG: tRNA adenosine(34) deaminase TadA [Candidatus Aminicenantes bacterium]|jgi:tRNA(Arg) A34 adenosine deaminase TadA